MLYQKLLMGNKPYFISVGSGDAFEIHRHPEVEINYCIEGNCNIICENKQYTLFEGDLAVIFPMSSHEIPVQSSPCKILTIEVGYTLIGNSFDAFAMQNTNCFVYRKSEMQNTKEYKKLSELLEETAHLDSSISEFGELIIKGNLYIISAILLEMLHNLNDTDIQSKKSNDIKKIEKALDAIYNSYYEPLDVEKVSALCGYSQSNFCKIFKNITGDTFHDTLNRHRTDIACILLRETDYTIERIAQETGFSDSKSFCRVFKKIMDVSAGEYRKSIKAK